MKTTMLAAAFAVAASLSCAASVHAGLPFTNSDTANAVALCQGALPAFEGALRKRPLAVQNEGTAPAFVSCAFTGDGGDADVYSFGVYARSTNGTASVLTCTAVLGYDAPGVIYATKSVDLPANGNQVSIYWYDEDFPAGKGDPEIWTGSPVSMSCSLPAGGALNDTYFNHTPGSNAPA